MKCIFAKKHFCFDLFSLIQLNVYYSKVNRVSPLANIKITHKFHSVDVRGFFEPLPSFFQMARGGFPTKNNERCFTKATIDTHCGKILENHSERNLKT